METRGSVPTRHNQAIIYANAGVQSILDGTLNGIQPFTCRMLVDRDTRQSHDSPDAVTYPEYLGLAADSVQALVLRGLRTAVYCSVGDQARQIASAIRQRRVDTSDDERPVKVGVIGRHLQSIKENTGTIRAFNQGRLEVLVASKQFETETSIRPDALVITARSMSKRALENVLLNVSHADPEHPALTVIEMIEIAAGQYGRSTFTTWDILGKATIRQGEQIGGYLDSRSDPAKVFVPEDLPEQLKPRFEQLDGSPVAAAVIQSATDRDLEPILPDLQPISEIAARFAPHIPVKSVHGRLTHAGLQVRNVYQEVDGQIVTVPYFLLSKAIEFFAEHPVPPVAHGSLETVDALARRHGVSHSTVDAVIRELGDQITAHPCLQPQTLREWSYYDKDAQQLIDEGVLRHKAAFQALYDGAEQRRATAAQTAKVYPPVEEGDISLAKLAAEAGVAYTYAKKQLQSVVDLSMRKPRGGRQGLYIPKDQIEQARQYITPLPPPMHLIPTPAIHGRLHNWYPRRIEKCLMGYPAFQRRQPGKGPLVTDRPWSALRHAESELGKPAEEVPIIWDDLPVTEAGATKEQESYARAIQIVYLDAHRLGAAAIMSRETALNYLIIAYESTTGKPWPDTGPTPQTPFVGSGGTPAKESEQEPDVPAEAEPQTLQSMWLDDYAAEFNHTYGGKATGNDFVRLAEEIGAELCDDETYGPYLTDSGRHTMNAYITKLRSAPKGWVRVTECARSIGAGFHTVNDYLTDIGKTDGVGAFQAHEGSLRLVRFVSPERAAQLQKQFSLSVPAQPPISAPSPTPAQPRQRTLKQQAATPAPETQQNSLPKLPAGTRVLHHSKPISLVDIVELTGCDTSTVREAIQAIREQLGPKKFNTISARDKYGVLTDHYSDPVVLTALEDHLLGAHPAELAYRLNIRQSTIIKFLDEVHYSLAENGRVQGDALKALLQYFAKS